MGRDAVESQALDRPYPMIWINGSLANEASVSVLDHGFTVGDGVFETIKSLDGQAFALTRHLDRLEASARGMAMPIPDRTLVTRAVNEVLEASKAPVGRLRITWTTGSGGAGSQRAASITPTLVVTHNVAGAWPENAKVATVSWPRNNRSPLVHLKTISYAENVLALEQAHQVGAEEAIFFNLDDNLSEGTGSNVIVRIDGRWVTPPLQDGALAGVTRALAIKWCGVTERSISRREFLQAQEILLSSTTRDLQAVGCVNGDGIAGTSSQEVRTLIDRFAECASQEIDP